MTSPDGVNTTISEKLDREDQYDVLKRVIGNLESITDKKKPGEAKNEQVGDIIGANKDRGEGLKPISGLPLILS